VLGRKEKRERIRKGYLKEGKQEQQEEAKQQEEQAGSGSTKGTSVTGRL
jgi:hypothetical protein